MNDNDITFVPVILGATEVAKRLGIPGRAAPVVAVIVGICLKGFGEGFRFDSVLNGILLGLSASGLWSGTRATILNK